MRKLITGLTLVLLLAVFAAEAVSAQEMSRLRRGARMARLFLGSEVPFLYEAPRCAPSRGSLPGLISVIGCFPGRASSRSSEARVPRRVPDQASTVTSPVRVPSLTSSFSVPESSAVPKMSSGFTVADQRSEPGSTL